MSSYGLVISPIARNDLEAIYQFGMRNWGNAQSSKYLDSIKVQLWRLIEQPLMGIERPELLPDMRSFPIASHVIFYRLPAIQIEIVRVLHRKQDPNRHIK